MKRKTVRMDWLAVNPNGELHMNVRPVTQTATLLAILLVPVAAGGQQALPAGVAPGQDLTARVERRLGKLHDALGITSAEDAMWS